MSISECVPRCDTLKLHKDNKWFSLDVATLLLNWRAYNRTRNETVQVVVNGSAKHIIKIKFFCAERNGNKQKIRCIGIALCRKSFFIKNWYWLPEAENDLSSEKWMILIKNLLYFLYNIKKVGKQLEIHIAHVMNEGLWNIYL